MLIIIKPRVGVTATDAVIYNRTQTSKFLILK